MRPHRHFIDILTEEVLARRVLKMAVVDDQRRLAPLACVPLLELGPVDGPGPVLVNLRENGLRTGPRVHSAVQRHGGRRSNCRGRVRRTAATRRGRGDLHSPFSDHASAAAAAAWATRAGTGSGICSHCPRAHTVAPCA